MSRALEITVPEIGAFRDVDVVEVLVAAGQHVDRDQSLVTLESDKATMEVPSPAAGEIRAVHVRVGSKVSQGSAIASLALDAESDAAAAGATAAPEPPPAAATPEPAGGSATRQAPGAQEHAYDLVVIGAGPGGYSAAFRAADLGLRVALVERYSRLGGVCLNVGCIPSKALLHAGGVITQAAALAEHGVSFGEPRIDLDRLRSFKDGVVERLTGGLASMAARRKVEVVQGVASFTSAHELQVKQAAGVRTLGFAHAIIAVGSHSVQLPGFPWGDPRLMDSTSALTLEEIPRRLLVVGGGIIGLEMACVFDALGSRVTVVELTSQLIPGADADLVKPLQARIAKRYENIFTETRVKQVDVADDALVAHFEGGGAPPVDRFDRVLVAVGRAPNGKRVGAEGAGVAVTDRGYIEVDSQMRSNVPHIFAIGDVVGQPMLAHKATHEGKVAAEVCAGHKSHFDARVIPSVAYTDPEIAWVGATENEARAAGLEFDSARFPWVASGRALGIGRTDGFTKLLFDRKTRRIIGAGIAGPHAGELVAECALAIEMGCEATDIALTIHPHPTLSESIGMAAEVFDGTITDLYLPRRR